MKKNKVAKDNGKPEPELIIKTRPEWIKSSLATKNKYEDKYSLSIKKSSFPLNFSMPFLFISLEIRPMRPHERATHCSKSKEKAKATARNRTTHCIRKTKNQ